jgi:glucose dehydrogenase
MRPAAGVFAAGGVLASVLLPASAQTKPAATATAQEATASTTVYGTLPTVREADKSDWPLHNLDLSNRRFSALNEINVSNADKLALKWSFDAGESIAEITPLVIDGVMYLNAGSKLLSVDAATGKPIWTFQLKPAFCRRGKGAEQSPRKSVMLTAKRP